MSFANNSETTDSKGTGASVLINGMLAKEDYPVEEENTGAVFKIHADGGTHTKQQRIQNNIDAYNERQVKPKISLRMNLDFPVTCKAPQKSKKGGKNYASKMVLAELGKKVDKFDLINKLAQAQAQAQADISFGHTSRKGVHVAKNEL